MTREGTVTLVVPTYGRDALKQLVKTGEELLPVFCQIESVSQSEWSAAGINGLKAEYKVTVWADEYRNAATAILDGVRYSIYRTFQRSEDIMELYLTRKAGI